VDVPEITLRRRCECLYRVLGIVVVPRNPVVIEKGEKLVAIFRKPLLTLKRGLAEKMRSVKNFIEPVNVLLMLPQEMSLQSPPINGFDDGEFEGR
jgi:hypothetical protein